MLAAISPIVVALLALVGVIIQTRRSNQAVRQVKSRLNGNGNHHPSEQESIEGMRHRLRETETALAQAEEAKEAEREWAEGQIASYQQASQDAIAAARRAEKAAREAERALALCEERERIHLVTDHGLTPEHISQLLQMQNSEKKARPARKPPAPRSRRGSSS